MIRGGIREGNRVHYLICNICGLTQPSAMGNSNSEIHKHITTEHKESFDDGVIEWDRS